MDKAHILGFWAEHCGEGFPSIKFAPRGSLSKAESELVATYLAACPIWISSPGAEESQLHDNVIAGTSSIRTDGEWAWHDTIAFYVRMHGIFLPDKFLQAVRAKNYLPPAENAVNLLTLEIYSDLDS